MSTGAIPAIFPYTELIFFTTAYFIIGKMMPYVIPKLRKQHLLKRRDDEVYYGDHTSFIHSIVCCFLCIMKLTTEGFCYCQENSTLSRMTVAHSLAYFIQDTIMGEIKGYNDFFLRLHHVITLLTIGPALFRSHGAHEAINGIFLSEITNPVGEVRMILKLRHLTYTKQYLICAVIFAVGWIVIRSIILLPFIWMNYLCVHDPLILSLGGSLITLISCHYSIIILYVLNNSLQGIFRNKDNPEGKILRVWNKFVNGIHNSLKMRTIFHLFYLVGFTLLPLAIWSYRWYDSL